MEPISLAEVKDHLKILDDTSQDDYIESLIPAARDMVEERTGKDLVQRERVEYHKPDSCGVTLFHGPVASVAVTDVDGARMYNGRLHPAASSSWPSLVYPDRLEVTYLSGYEPDEIPPALIRAMLVALLPMFERRPMTSDEERCFTSLCDLKSTVSL